MVGEELCHKKHSHGRRGHLAFSFLGSGKGTVMVPKKTTSHSLGKEWRRELP
jgi:hypothetical protein